MQNTRFIRRLFAAAGWLLATQAACAGTGQDVRILIDVSGSMKQNDPHTLRAPALRLLTGLLPAGTRAGVWTYGRYVNMLVPHGSVDAQWREQARRAADELHSKGLFTDIEEALDRASRDWREADPAMQRSLILLTDGFVDVSDRDEADAASRQRVVNEILPRLQQAGVKIYSVALSDSADSALLRQLAEASGGWYEQVRDAAALQRVFLRLFEKAVRPDTLPLTGNRVKVDESIEEMTLLIFRAQQERPTLLTSPDGHRFGKTDAPGHVRWHQDMGYDLITVTSPAPGEWIVTAGADPDNRVTVITNLKVRATVLPNNMSTGDTLDYSVQLTQQDELIAQREFLDLLDISLGSVDGKGTAQSWTLVRAGADGAFALESGHALREGRHQLVLTVDGKTFQREQRQTVNVYAEPVAVAITPAPERSGVYSLSVIPYSGMIELDSMEVTAGIKDARDEERALTLTRQGPAEWRAEITADEHFTPGTVTLTVHGQRANGKPVDARVGPLRLAGGGVARKPVEEKTAPPPVVVEAHPAVPAPEEHINGFAVLWQVFVMNALLGGGGIYAYRRWRRATQPLAVVERKLDT